MELDFDASNLVEDEAVEVEHNGMTEIEGERCGICMDIIIDRGVLDCCQHWFCFECIDNWSTIMNLCPLCQREFQLITCVPVFDSGESSKVDEDLFACLNYLSGLFVLNYLWPIMINLY
uniref:F8M12.8 protein n=1 Tax=Arabidopsis thaliana TaxID=3702 RepID=O81621_ARATH|nr:contains similarity to C3HC4-type zinc fingers (Pfam:zf-C3HC4.hmm, score: 34.87) [Arabidopsis thaliana]